MIFRRYSASNGNYTPADLFNINKSNGCAIIITGNTKYPQNLPLKITPSTVVSSSCFKKNQHIWHIFKRRGEVTLFLLHHPIKGIWDTCLQLTITNCFSSSRKSTPQPSTDLTLAPGAQFSFVTQTPPQGSPSSREPLFLKSSCNSNKKTRVIPDKSNNTTASSLEKM